MSLLLLLRSDAVTVVPVASGKSGYTRAWLMDYYTRKLAKPVSTVTPPKRKRRAAQRVAAQEDAEEAAIAAKVDALVSKAERDIAEMAAKINDAQAAETFIADLLATAQQYAFPIYDFKLIGHDYNEDEDDLLLFAAVL